MRRIWGIRLVLAGLLIGGEAGAVGVHLVGTPTAPYASGIADINHERVSLELDRLQPGIYEIQAELKSTRQVVSLAWVAVIDPEWVPSIETGGSIKVRDSTHQATVLRTRVQAGLPPSVQAGDIAAIAVADWAGCEWLAGRLEEPADGYK